VNLVRRLQVNRFSRAWLWLLGEDAERGGRVTARHNAKKRHDTGAKK
jgi:hypothetical protein